MSAVDAALSQLFSPITFGPLALANRIVIAPMCQYSAQDGRASDWHRIHLGTLSQSGAGLLILEAAAVVPEGRISYADLGLYDDATEQALAEVLQSVRRWSPMPIGIQLAHAGRKASTDLPWKGGEAIAPDHAHGWQTVSASALPFRQGQPVPQALDEAGIDAVVDAFVASAKRAERLGLELIELHAAHGYLMHQFLSPLSNQRSDAYGGSLENRMRLTLRIFDGAQVNTPVIGVGLITEPAQAEAILQEGQADAIALARGILYDPRWPWHAAAALGASVTPAPQYLRCEPRDARGVFAPTDCT
ncbi:oxidoreductase [Xanthomonas euvesicatoria pv. alangii]|uniref:oxidoreductase n=1 Tax=Xanthomonas euvesicatoria TaxID=456327 RepID=UPI001C46271A|nr:oxidoreductase [Xanthomonas euvesicatoria]MBV6668919.1 oxidoreductase [Xanthomonas euvesicatoria pv. alangii]